MTLSYDDAAAQLTAPGERYETEQIEVRGVAYTAFKGVPASLRDLFDLTRGYGATPFLVYEDETYSYDEVYAAADGLAAVLQQRYGVAKGDRVAIAMRNYPEWIMTYLATLSIGAVVVSMNAWWTADELDYGLEDSGAKVLVADVERVERTRESAARLGVATIGVRLGDTAASGAVDRWDDVVATGVVPERVEIGPDDDATILYTSGTTGRPKGAVSTHRAVLQALMGFSCKVAIDSLRRPAEGSGRTGSPVFILIVPLFHVTGNVPVFLGSLASGLKLVIMHKWDPGRALELIEREKVTNFVGVPTQSWDLLEHPDFAKYDTSSLASVGGGGAPAPPQLVSRVSNSFKAAKPNIGYGMTETNAYGPGNSGTDYETHPTSTGRATPILQIEIRDAQDQPVPVGERGEICMKGPNLIRGYWNRPEATAETFVDGWLHTGDLGRVDDEGFVYIEDRAKDMILRGGENVYSAEVEAAIYEHPAVYEAAVFGVPHERLGEEVAAAIVPRPGMDIDPDELTAFLKARIAGFKVPTKVMTFTEALPRNPAGKILKRDLRDQFVSD
ncbi:AMP-binding protein [Aquihabitans sp. G128]|uniref:class I adenylate-forming enzyme family protein n=1 Tax=Aquihabitans sp. G128 TaxID=2849779 RepID=UPI001C220D97|nr:AMP-binding protein [Aquihabitans sp. G128]QXC62446.1 AMP-binding protein [Aquihabitans sp. G128]